MSSGRVELTTQLLTMYREFCNNLNSFDICRRDPYLNILISRAREVAAVDQYGLFTEICQDHQMPIISGRTGTFRARNDQGSFSILREIEKKLFIRDLFKTLFCSWIHKMRGKWKLGVLVASVDPWIR